MDKIKYIIGSQEYFSDGTNEREIKRQMFANNSPESEVKCVDPATDEIFDILKLEDIFNTESNE